VDDDSIHVEKAPVKKAKIQVMARHHTLPKKLDTFSYNRHKTSMKLKTISDLQSRKMVSTEMRIIVDQKLKANEQNGSG